MTMNFDFSQRIGVKTGIEMFLEKYKRKSEDTLNNYQNTLQMMSKNIFDKDLMQLESGEIERMNHIVLTNYRNHLVDHEKNKNVTVNNRISAIKEFIRYLAANEVINYDISKLDLVETLNDDSDNTEMIPEDKFYEYINYFETQEKEKGLEKKLACLLMLETGNRAQEVLNACKNQFIKHQDGYIFKSVAGNKGKGNKEYIEYIGEDLYNQLMKLNPDNEMVFSVTYTALNKAFNRANKYFGNEIIKYTAHSIKHLAVTLEYRYTKDILAAQKKGKHSNVETTRRYLKTEDKMILGAFSRKQLTNENSYKESDLESLINVIDELPKDIKDLINMKLSIK